MIHLEEPDKTRKLNGSYPRLHACGHITTTKVSYKSRFSASGLYKRYGKTTSLCKRCKYFKKLEALRQNPTDDVHDPKLTVELGAELLKKKLKDWIVKRSGHPVHSSVFRSGVSYLLVQSEGKNFGQTVCTVPKLYWMAVLTEYESIIKAPHFIKDIRRQANKCGESVCGSADLTIAVYDYQKDPNEWIANKNSIYDSEFFLKCAMAGLAYVCKCEVEDLPKELNGPFGWLASLRLSGKFDDLVDFGIRAFKNKYLDEPMAPGDIEDPAPDYRDLL